MPILTKYIIFNLASSMALICVTLTGIAWLINSLKYLKYIVNSGLNFSTFLYLSSLTLPSLLMLTLPLSLFLSVLITYNRLGKDSEMTVMKSCGMSRYNLASPAIIFAIFITMISYLISLYLLPASYREFKDMENIVRDKHGAALLQEGVFNSLSKNFTFYFRERDDEGNFRGILIHDDTKKNKTTTFMAQYGYPTASSSGDPRLMTYNGNAQEVNRETNELLQTEFESHIIDLKFFTSTFNNSRWREPEERYLQELFYPTDTEDRFLQKLRAEGHQRIIWPLYNILLVVIALFAHLTGELNRRGQSKKNIITISIAVSFFIIGLVLKFIVAGNASLTAMMYITIILAIVIGLYFLLFSNKTKVIS